MSKNYELLQRIESERWKAEARGTAESRTHDDTGRPDLDPRTFTALAGLVQNLFLSKDLPNRCGRWFSRESTTGGIRWIAAHTAQVLSSQVDTAVCLVDARDGR